MECAKSETEKISTMLDEFNRTKNNEILQKACQRFSNNKEVNPTYFTIEKWQALCQEKGIVEVPALPNRWEALDKKLEEKRQNEIKQTPIAKHFISLEELKENYEQTSQTSKENAMSELKRRANLILRAKQKKMEEYDDGTR